MFFFVLYFVHLQAVLLVSSVALCLAASDKKVEKTAADKNVQKRGLLGLGAEYGHFAAPLQHATPFLHDAAPFIPSQQLIAGTNGFVPAEPIHELAHPLPLTEARALPLAHALPAAHFAAPAAHLAGPGLFEPTLAHARALQYAPQFAAQAVETLPAAHLAAPALPLEPVAHAVHAEAHQQVIPTHFKTIVKNVAVPYERRVPIDNPIYIQVERQVPIDNPVPVLKYVRQPYPVHVEEKVPVPIYKEIQVPRPYIQRVLQPVQPVQQIAFQKTYAAPLAAPAFAHAAPAFAHAAPLAAAPYHQALLQPAY